MRRRRGVRGVWSLQVLFTNGIETALLRWRAHHPGGLFSFLPEAGSL